MIACFRAACHSADLPKSPKAEALGVLFGQVWVEAFTRHSRALIETPRNRRATLTRSHDISFSSFVTHQRTSPKTFHLVRWLMSRGMYLGFAETSRSDPTRRCRRATLKPRSRWATTTSFPFRWVRSVTAVSTKRMEPDGMVGYMESPATCTLIMFSGCGHQESGARSTSSTLA